MRNKKLMKALYKYSGYIFCLASNKKDKEFAFLVERIRNVKSDADDIFSVSVRGLSDKPGFISYSDNKPDYLGSIIVNGYAAKTGFDYWFTTKSPHFKKEKSDRWADAAHSLMDEFARCIAHGVEIEERLGFRDPSQKEADGWFD